jgi:tetratricopeptide (TPR) repeat protein
LHPYRREYHHELAESYFHTADTGEAIEHYKKALSLGDLTLAYNHMGVCLAWEGNHGAAEEALKRYLALDDSSNACDSLGGAYINAGKYDLAIEMEEIALRKNPDTFYARRTRACIEILLGRYRSAEIRLKDHFLSPNISDSEKARCQAALAFLYFKMGKPELALQAYKLGLEKLGAASFDLPKDELTWIKGLIEIQRGNLSGGREALNQMRVALTTKDWDATNYNPWYKYYLDLLMQLSALEGNSQESLKAIHDLKFIKEKLGYWATIYDRAFFFDSIGKTYMSLKELNEAENAYREALKYNPHFAPALLHLAQLLKDMGRVDQAKDALQSFFLEWKDADADSSEYAAATRLMADL